jgi:hypothetical protein
VLISTNSAILAILGIGDAGHNAITRTAALMALVSALMSLGFGGAYTIRFSSLKTPQRGLVWLLVRIPPLNPGAESFECPISGDEDDDFAADLEYMDILIPTSRLACLVGTLLLRNHRFVCLDIWRSPTTILGLG